MTLILLWLAATMLVALAVSTMARWLGPGILIGAYSASLAIAITVAGKLGVIPGLEEFSLSASIFVYSATFIFTDLLSELFGKKAARMAVISGICVYPMLLITTKFAAAWEPHPVWALNQPAFETVMATTFRVTLASLCAFITSQLHDVWAFHFWKDRTGGRHLWLRNNLSTVTSQAIDTVVFYFVAFFGIFPLGKLIVATYLVKILIAVIDTPVVYLAKYLITKGDEGCGNGT